MCSDVVLEQFMDSLDVDDAGLRLEAVIAAAAEHSHVDPHEILANFHAGSDPSLQRRAAAALERMGPQGAAALGSQLGHKDDVVRRYAMHALVGLGPQGAEVLRRRVSESTDPLARRSALEALMWMERQGADVLVGLLKHPNAAVRQDVAGALADFAERVARQDPESLELGVRECRSVAKEFPITFRHAHLFGCCLAETCEGVALEVIRGLIAMGPSGAAELVEQMKVGSDSAKCRAAGALKRMGETGAKALANRLGDSDAAFRRRLGQALLGMGGQGTSALARALQTADEPVARWNAAKLLGETGQAAAPYVDVLAEALKDSSQWVRVAAARALESLGVKNTGSEAAVLVHAEQQLATLAKAPGPINALSRTAAARAGGRTAAVAAASTAEREARIAAGSIGSGRMGSQAAAARHAMSAKTAANLIVARCR